MIDNQTAASEFIKRLCTVDAKAMDKTNPKTNETNPRTLIHLQDKQAEHQEKQEARLDKYKHNDEMLRSQERMPTAQPRSLESKMRGTTLRGMDFEPKN